jgi:hypothetical protein
VYNSTLLYGYVNYMFGVGLCALVLAYSGPAVSMREPSVGLVTGLVFAAYLAHRSAYVSISATVCVVESFAVISLIP